jgi:hypothetical protein
MHPTLLRGPKIAAILTHSFISKALPKLSHSTC